MREDVALVADLDRLHKQVKRDRESHVRIGRLLDATETETMTAERWDQLSELTAVTADRDRLSSELTAVTADRDRLSSELVAIKQSTAWRITKPLRRSIEFIRSIPQRGLYL
jgi:hypothetical protein